MAIYLLLEKLIIDIVLSLRNLVIAIASILLNIMKFFGILTILPIVVFVGSFLAPFIYAAIGIWVLAQGMIEDYLQERKKRS